VVGQQEPEALEVIRAKTVQLGAPCYLAVPEAITVHESRLHGQVFSATLNGVSYDHLRVALPGLHQVDNCLVALQVLQLLQQQESGFNIPEEALRKGLETVHWMGRLEILQQDPLFILDGAHNLAGARSLAGSIQLLLPEQPVTLLTGMMADKDVRGFLKILLPKVSQVVVTRPDNPRAMPAEILASLIADSFSHEVKGIYVEAEPERAVEKALAITPEDGAVICAGSLYMLGRVRQWVLEGRKEIL
jgi:dihydrofolate synthase / folylpolyglutamate synthase